MSDEQRSNKLGQGLTEMGEVEEHAGFEADLQAGQPAGLWVLFITEMWERFSYYGMRALFVLFLIASTKQFLPSDLGMGAVAQRQAAVISVIADQTGVPADQITLESKLEGKLAMDAAQRDAFVSALETKFDVPFPVGAEPLSDAASVGDLVRYASEEGKGRPNWNPGFGWTDASAYALYGVYTFMAYLTSIFGGIVADRLLGTHKSMLIGGWIIALGHITLAGMAFFPHEAGVPVSLAHSSGILMEFLIGCSLIVIGTGFFKPCVSVMVGQLYHKNDPRRDSGFTIFYMGINLGAFFSPLVAGSLAKFVGWHWGFGSAAVGMLAGLFFYQMFRGRYLKGIGEPPREPLIGRDKFLVTGSVLMILAAPLVPLGLFVFGGLDPVIHVWDGVKGQLGIYGIAGLITGIVLVASGLFLIAQPKQDRGPLGVILILAFIGNIFFWTAFEQAGSSLNVFAERSTDRTLYGLIGGPGFPAEYYQSVNPLAILIFAPIFSWLWLRLEKMKKDPSTPVKFAVGLWLLGLSFGAMVLGAMDAKHGLAGPHWLLITYLVCTWGELCLSPVGLSMVTKLAPRRLQSLMMGLWFFTFALSSLLAGLVAQFSTQFVPEEIGATPEKTFIIPGLPGFFLMLVFAPIAAGFVIFVISPIIKKMMHGIK